MRNDRNIYIGEMKEFAEAKCSNVLEVSFVYGLRNRTFRSGVRYEVIDRPAVREGKKC